MATESPARLFDLLINPNTRMKNFMPDSLMYRTSGAIGAATSTSDFVGLLSNLADKVALASYDAMRAKQTFEPFVRRTRDVSNYKEQTRVKVGSPGEHV